MPFRTLALAGALAALAGCGATNDTVNLGTDPAFLWWTDHETGDLGDWTRGGAAMGYAYENGGGTVGVAAGPPGRSGDFALVSTIPAAAGATPAAQVSRRGLPAPDGYYGAWLYVPAFARPATYWVFFSFHASGGDVILWDLKLAATDAGALTLQLFRQGSGDVTPLRDVVVPLGRWVQVQAYFRAKGDAADVLRVWLDDALVFEVAGPDAAGAAGISWILGSITDGLAPGPVSLFIDDAFITTRRIDPHAREFSRGP